VTEQRSTDLDPRWEAADVLATIYTLGYLSMVGATMCLSIPEPNQQIVNTLVSLMSAIQLGIGKFYYDGSKADKQAQKAAVVQQARTSSAIQEIAKGAAVAPLPPAPAAPISADNTETPTKEIP